MFLPKTSHLAQVLLRPNDVNESVFTASVMAANPFPVLFPEKVTVKESTVPSQFKGE